MNEDNHKIVSVGQIDISGDKFNKEPDYENLPILPTRDLVMFPGVTFPITLGRTLSIYTAEQAAGREIPIGIVCQKNPSVEHPEVPSDLYNYGVVADVIKVFEIPDGPKTAIVRARNRIRILGKGEESAISGALTAKTAPVQDGKARVSDKEFIAVAQAVKESALNIIKKSPEVPSDLVYNIQNFPDPAGMVNLIATHTPFPTEFKMELLKVSRIKDRAFKLLTELSRNEQIINLTHDIQERTKQNMSEQQRSAFLQQQMESIRQELYGDDDDAAMFRKKAENVAFPDEVRKSFERDVEKLNRLNPQSPDYAVLYSYLELLLDLPWGINTPHTTDLTTAEEILNADHYGLEKVKERILEQLAVLMNTPDGNAPILCLVGAPGVGKTSLGQSIAKALGRKYQRVALGGIHDEAEIRGHRRTYIGAMPGRIIDAMRRCGSSNPVLLLDEIDKMGSDFKGDPSAALLEVLDPEQNCRFHDNYVDVDYDLSKALFIATANNLSTLSQPLLDRMEVIDISGYLLEEKQEIARRHLLPRILKENGFTEKDLSISPEALIAIIEGYTSESGVRQLEKKLAAVVRKAVLKKVSKKPFPKVIEPQHLREYLGVETYTKDRYEGNDYAGVVTGLAWTSVGGEILYIESSLSKGKGEKLTLTGNLGDVMKESAIIALQYVKAHAAAFGIDTDLFEKYQLHIHVPEGAIPKDGPSAGITMATSIVSAFTQRKVRPRIAMTGEITLRGKVLPVGGIKEKILAAKRAGINTIILSTVNKKDVEDIPAIYLQGLNFEYVTDVQEVINLALLNEKVSNPLPLD